MELQESERKKKHEGNYGVKKKERMKEKKDEKKKFTYKLIKRHI